MGGGRVDLVAMMKMTVAAVAALQRDQQEKPEPSAMIWSVVLCAVCLVVVRLARRLARRQRVADNDVEIETEVAYLVG